MGVKTTYYTERFYYLQAQAGHHTNQRAKPAPAFVDKYLREQGAFQWGFNMTENNSSITLRAIHANDVKLKPLSDKSIGIIKKDYDTYKIIR